MLYFIFINCLINIVTTVYLTFAFVSQRVLLMPNFAGTIADAWRDNKLLNCHHCVAFFRKSRKRPNLTLAPNKGHRVWREVKSEIVDVWDERSWYPTDSWTFLTELRLVRVTFVFRSCERRKNQPDPDLRAGRRGAVLSGSCEPESELWLSRIKWFVEIFGEDGKAPRLRTPLGEEDRQGLKRFDCRRALSKWSLMNFLIEERRRVEEGVSCGPVPWVS